MSDGNGQKYFVRIHGKIMGPFAVDQMRSLRDRGRLREEHEISVDRRHWEPAARLESVFAASQTAVLSVSETSVSPTPDAGGDASEESEAVQWYYTQHGKQSGPVPFGKLARMSQRGEIERSDLVWHEGLPDWIPAEDIDGLFAGAEAPPRKSKRRREPETGLSYDAGGQTILWDAFLGAVRQQTTDAGMEAINRGFVWIGGWAINTTILLGACFMLIQAIQTDSLQIILVAMIGVLCVSALRYAAIHLALSGDVLVRTTRYRLSTPAALHVAAVVFLFLGIVAAATPVYYSLLADELRLRITLLAAAAQSILVFGFASYAALHPNWLGIDICPGARAGEEGIAIAAIFLKALVRLATAAFALGSVVGAFYTVAALVALASQSDGPLSGLDFATMGITQTLSASVTPMFAYIALVLGSIILDISHALISGLKSAAE